MTAILKATTPVQVGKHAYKGSQVHSTGTGQEVHGGAPSPPKVSREVKAAGLEQYLLDNLAFWEKPEVLNVKSDTLFGDYCNRNTCHWNAVMLQHKYPGMEMWLGWARRSRGEPWFEHSWITSPADDAPPGEKMINETIGNDKYYQYWGAKLGPDQIKKLVAVMDTPDRLGEPGSWRVNEWDRTKREILDGKKNIVKHAYKGSQIHSTGTGQEVHGGKGALKPDLDWNPLNRLKPGRDGEVAEILIAARDETMGNDEQTMTMKASIVDRLHARLKDNIDVLDYVETAGIDGKDDTMDPLSGYYPDEPVKAWISGLINDWASMHQDGVNHINMAIGRQFGIPTRQELPGWVEDGVEGGLPYDDMYRHAHEAFVQAMYDETQAFLANAPDRMIFFRGLKGMYYSGELNDSLDQWRIMIDDRNRLDTPGSKLGDWPGMIYTDAMLKGRPGASWSASYSTAKEFAQGGVVLMVSVPKTAILSTAQTGIGALFEDEVVLVDHGNNAVTVLSASQTEGSFNRTEAVVGRKLQEVSNETLAYYGLKPSLASPKPTVPFPRTTNTHQEKVAWSRGVLDRFYSDGVWVDTMEDPDTWSPDEIRDEYLS